MKVFNIIKNIVLDIIIIFLIIIIIFSFFNNNKPVPLFKHYFFTVMSGSMTPALNVGDSIIVKEVDKYEVGDIITYKSDKTYVTHRIVKIDGKNVITKGDANTTEDPAFDKKNILGKFVYKSNWLNFLIKNRILIILIVIIIYLVQMVIDTLRKKEDNNEAKIN